MFVVAADFDLQPFNLPGLDKVSNNFAEFITEQEDEKLRRLFGTTFWEAFKDGVTALPDDWDVAEDYAVDDLVVYGPLIYKALEISTDVIPSSDPVKWEVQPEDRWLTLRYGALYTYLRRDYKWVGMKQMVKPLIYSLWVQYEINDQLSSLGNIKSKSENADVVSPNVRICRSWNRYNELASGKFYNRYLDSIFGYLVANSTVFDDIVDPAVYTNFYSYLVCEFKYPGRMNDLDL